MSTAGGVTFGALFWQGLGVTRASDPPFPFAVSNLRTVLIFRSYESPMESLATLRQTNRPDLLMSVRYRVTRASMIASWYGSSKPAGKKGGV